LLEAAMTLLKPIDLMLMAVTVLSICTGQVLFKMVALRANEHQTYFATSVLTLLFIALAIYGTATLVWIRVLQTVPLAVAYMFMSLSFVLVPLIAVLLFREPVSARFIVGACLIVVGLGISATR
jgi:undecaprenyl phosphate-alpha-L-ara4N flippase subunit ArnE